jgi:hypothetical protein
MKCQLSAKLLEQIMKNIIATTLAVGFAAFTLAGTAVAGDPVERPYKSKGHVAVRVDLTTFKGTGTWDNPESWNGPPIFPYVSIGSGTATHLGRFTATFTGAANYLTGKNSGYGKTIAANGDELWGHFEEPVPTGEGGVGTFTGGTGRFHHASGSASQTQFNRVEYNYYDAESDILYLVIEYDVILLGTITY